MRVLRALARVIIRGPGAGVVLGDLDETWRRDLQRGVPQWRSQMRYAHNAFLSAISLALGRIRRPISMGPTVSVLDLKVAFRMLVKYPGLTFVTVFALALGIPASLFPVQLLSVFTAADLPVDGGDRIVGLRYQGLERMDAQLASAFEYSLWRDRLSGVDAVGAVRTQRFNLVAGDGRVVPVRGAETTASALHLLGVPPSIGRLLVDADEVPGAPDVVLLGYRQWQSGFAADPEVVGRSLLVGGQPHTVVGVMPEGFEFPLRDRFWIPLKATRPRTPGVGPGLMVVARLSEGATEAQLAGQLMAIHTGLEGVFPEMLADIRPEVTTFFELVTGNSGSAEDIALIVVWQLFTLLLLAVACGNIGTLVLARTSARSAELTIRSALGAGRLRIVGQLFFEALVLALAATGVGLGVAYFVAERFADTLERSSELPYFLDFSLDPRTVMAALVLAIFCAGVAGVVPALRATSGGIQGTLQRAMSGHGLRFGAVTSALIVVEVALGVASLFGGGVAILMAPDRAEGIVVGEEQLLVAQLEVPRAGGWDGGEVPEAHAVRVASVHRELLRRLDSEPGLRGAALTRTLPAGMAHPTDRFELDGLERTTVEAVERVLVGRVGVGYLETLQVQVVAGRTFRDSDVQDSEEDRVAPVIVNMDFVEVFLDGHNPIGAAGQATRGPRRRVSAMVRNRRRNR